MDTPKDLLHTKVFVALEAANIMYEAIACDPALADTAAFCEAYGYAPEESANTILVAAKGGEPAYAVCLVLATTKLDVNKKVCSLLGVKKASFASKDDTVRLSSMEIGGVTIAGIEGLPVYIDSAVMDRPRVVIGGGNRSSKVVLNPTELGKLPGVKVVDGLAAPRN